MKVGLLQLKLQIFRADQLAMSPHRADFLEALDREGSIAAAARAMGLSYRASWMLVANVNSCWRENLVTTAGSQGRNHGAKLSPFGREVLQLYRSLEAEMEQSRFSEFANRLACLLHDESEAI
ncbi:MAG: LysR family transcriptional regulator [Novosphingobium sp.]